VDRGSSVSKVIGCGLDYQGQIPGRGRNFSLCHRVQTGSEGTLSLLSNGYWGLFPGGKEAGACSWPLKSV